MTALWACHVGGKGCGGCPQSLKNVLTRRTEASAWKQGPGDAFEFVFVVEYDTTVNESVIQAACVKNMNVQFGIYGQKLPDGNPEVLNIRRTTPAEWAELTNDGDWQTFHTTPVFKGNPVPKAKLELKDDTQSRVSAPPMRSDPMHDDAYALCVAVKSLSVHSTEVEIVETLDKVKACESKHEEGLKVARAQRKTCTNLKEQRAKMATHKTAKERWNTPARDWDRDELDRWFAVDRVMSTKYGIQPKDVNRINPESFVHAGTVATWELHEKYGPDHRSGHEDLDPFMIYVAWRPMRGQWYPEGWRKEIQVRMGMDLNDAQVNGITAWLPMKIFGMGKFSEPWKQMQQQGFSIRRADKFLDEFRKPGATCWSDYAFELDIQKEEEKKHRKRGAECMQLGDLSEP